MIIIIVRQTKHAEFYIIVYYCLLLFIIVLYPIPFLGVSVLKTQIGKLYLEHFACTVYISTSVN